MKNIAFLKERQTLPPVGILDSALLELSRDTSQDIPF
jgi:hypothetical protein